MSWTDDPDSAHRCPQSPGSVEGDEEVYRLLHAKNDNSPGERFKRNELQPIKPVQNNCGESSGLSVFRRAGLSDGEIAERAEEFAGGKGIASRGAVFAKAADIRSIELDGEAGEQIVFVYDDGQVFPDSPEKDNPLHVVIRVRQLPDRSSFDRVRDKLEEKFAPNRIDPLPGKAPEPGAAPPDALA
jgi:hypothetical protein